jgi:hypothetical protein
MARILPKTPDMRISTNDPEKATRDAVAEATAATKMRTPTGYGIVLSSARRSSLAGVTHLSLDAAKNPTSLGGRDLVPDNFSIYLMKQ